jgi:RimJ/RimL family protein N-acetyltransferase
MLWGEVEAKMKLSMRFIKDHLCFVAQQNGMIIGYAWVAFGEIYVSEIERTMKLQADEAEIYDVFVSREHRGKRVAHEMLRNICDYLREKGMRKACIAALSTNGASRRMIERMGFTKNGTVTFFKLFWMRKYSEDWRSSELATELV